MKLHRWFLLAAMAVGAAIPGRSAEKPLRVVATLPDYAALAREIGGDRVAVQAIVLGDQDAHYIRPKPSFVAMVRDADVLLDTGLDLEMWLPTVVDKSGNTKVRSGQKGYVAVAKGLDLLDKPKVISRLEGGVHVYGNPHITCSPVNMRPVARNIVTGFVANDPEGEAYYRERAERWVRALDERIFGKTLVDLLGGDTLAELAAKGKLYGFLETHSHEGRPLAELLGGWMGQMRPLRGTPIVTYHKNWIYFFTLFELEEAGTVEPKPGIPPSPSHVLGLIENMRQRNIRLLLAANYFDRRQVQTVAARVQAAPVIVPLYVGGEPGVQTYFDLVDLWVNRLLAAARNRQVIK